MPKPLSLQPVADRPYRAPIDPVALADLLRVLAHPARIELLQRLQVPQLSSEIRLPAHREDPRYETGRVMSRQAVEGHLAKLQEAGLVRALSAQRGGRVLEEWVSNPSRLFTVVDELRRLTLLPAARGDVTLGAARGDSPGNDDGPRLPRGPALLLVSGPLEGRAFALVGDGPWTIGRSGGTATIEIPFDPYVSRENTIIRRASGVLQVLADPASRNGTTLNWQVLAPGDPVALTSGDTIGVGRSLLVYREGGP